MNVFDASALLAFLQGEPGAELVETHLSHDGWCSTANWSETAQKLHAHGRDWHLARTLLLSYGLNVAPVTIDDAEIAARHWHRSDGRSLGDRLCLALAERLNATTWTADRSWGTTPNIRQIR